MAIANTDKADGYFRTRENKIVYRTYLRTQAGVLTGDYHQKVVQGVNGELPEGVTGKMVTSDE